MSGYIGKISALVTASTADLERKLNGSAESVKRFGRSLSSSLRSASRDAETSLDGIFTKTQRLQRAIVAGSGNANRRLRLIDPGDVNRLERSVQIAADINRPLTSAQKTFTGLSRTVAAEFQPALVRAQGQVIFLNRQLQELGPGSERGFNKVKAAVDRTIVSINQLNEAQQRVRALATGDELGFSDPRLAANLAAAQKAGQQAISLPASTIAADPQIEGLVRQINRVSELATAAAARVKAAANPAAAQQATKDYDRLNSVLEVLVGRLNKKYQIVIDTAAATTKADALRQELDFALTAKPQNFSQVEAVFRRLRGEVEQLAVAQRGAFGGSLGRLGDLVASGDIAKLNQARQLIDQIEADLASTKKLNLDTAAAEAKLKTVRDSLQQVAAGLSGSPRDPFELLKRNADQAKQAVDRVSDATRRQQLQQRLAGVQASIASDAGNAGLSEAQLRRLAARRAAVLAQITQDASARSSGDIFGPALGSSRQRVDEIQTRIQSLQGSIAQLPGPLQTKLLPALRRARDEFAALGTAPTAAQIARAAKQAENLEKQLRRAQNAAQFRGTFRQFLNDSSADRYKAQLDSVQRQLQAVGATAGGPVASAINQYRRALSEAANAGTLGTQKTRREMDQYVQAIARATVQTGLLTQAQAQAFAKSVASAGVRGGDIGRFGVDKASLALNQLAFAVDDLFSATGGLDQRIRAVSNNITQLGFVAGGTTGLFLGLAAVLGGQAFLAYQRFINKGVETQDRVKQLGEAAKRQADLVKELADAFDQLSDDLAQRGLTEATRRAEQLSKRLDDIIKKQAELRQQQLADVDPDVQDARRQQALLQRRLDNAETPGARIALQAQLDRERERERQAAGRVLGDARNVDIGASIRAITESIFREQLAGIADAGGVQAQQGVPFAERFPESQRFRIDTARARAESAFEGVDVSDLAAVRAAAVAQRDRLVDVANQRTVVGFRTGAAAEAEEGIAGVERLIRQLDTVGRNADFDRFAAGVAAAANSVDERLPRFLERISDAAEVVGAPALALQAEIEALVKGLAAQGGAINRARESDDTPAAERASKQAEAIAKEILARERVIVAIEGVVRSANSFAAALDRTVGQIVESVIGDARGAADQARRGGNRLRGLADAGLANPRDAAFAERQRARQEAAAADIEARAEGIRRQRRDLELRFRQEAEAGNLGANAQNLIRQRDAAQAVLENRQAAPADRTAAENTIATVTQQLQQLFESFPGAQRLAGLADALDAAAQGAIEFGNAVEQGRNLVLTDAQRVADDFIAQVQQINAALAAGEIDQGQRDAAIARIQQDGLRQLAPTIFGLADQVQNAILQGPSRAALQATDVSTVQGAQELNRLLRGDDSARDQPLVQLQQEANKILERIDRGIQNNEAKLAN